MFFEVNYKAKRKETVITISIGFLVISGVLSFKYSDFIFWPLFISIPVFVLGYFIQPIGVFITKVWFKMTQGIGWVTSKVILTFMYFLFITPYSFLIRFFTGKDILKKRPKKSLFIERNHRFRPKDLENPW